jgi:hypothetical protein
MEFVIKEFDVRLAQVPGRGWLNWFGGTPHPYNPSSLRVDDNWRAESFEEWVGVVRESLKDQSGRRRRALAASGKRRCPCAP